MTSRRKTAAFLFSITLISTYMEMSVHVLPSHTAVLHGLHGERLLKVLRDLVTVKSYFFAYLKLLKEFIGWALGSKSKTAYDRFLNIM